MVHYLVDLYQVCSNYGPGAKSDLVHVREMATLAVVVVFDLAVVIFLNKWKKVNVFSLDPG